MPKPIPWPSILDGFEYVGAVNGRRRWRSHGGRRLYEWDGTHGEVEVYNGRGRQEYAQWVRDPDTLARIIESRHESLPKRGVMSGR
jgi:hypothetical protein